MTISEFLDALGGRKAVAAALGIRPTTLNMFVYNGAIPLKHSRQLHELAALLGVQVTREEIEAMRERDNVD